MKPIRILIADDHLMVREGIIQLLELDGEIKCVGQASNGEECIELMEKLKPDVVLLDINMPKLNGLQVLEHVKKKKINMNILILTIHNEIEYLAKAVDIGVSGYVLKDSDSSVLKKAISIVSKGDTFIQPSLTPLLKERKNQEDLIISHKLTKREYQVLELLSEGLYNKEIAYKLSISEKTVKNHVSSIFKKIGVSDRTQAAVYAIKNNIVEIT